MIFEHVVNTLRIVNRHWARDLDLPALLKCLGTLDEHDLVELYCEAIYRRKAMPRGHLRRNATRLAQAAYILLPGDLCRLMIQTPLREAMNQAINGTQRVSPELLTAIMSARS